MIELLLRVIFSLAVVAGVIWAIARVLRKPMAKKAAGAMSVLARQQLGRNVSVAVIRVADQAFVVGVTEQQVSMLAEADLEAVEEAIAAAAPEQRSSVSLTGADELPAISLDPAAQVSAPRGRHGAAALDAAGPAKGAIAGSALSPQTWMQTVEFLRSRTARRA